MAGTTVVEVVTGTGGSGQDAGAMGNTSLMASLTPDEARELRECDKLLRFRDQVVGGLHPRIKPTHLSGKAAQSINAPSGPAGTKPTVPTAPSQPAAAKQAVNNDRPVINNFQAHQSNQQRAQVNMTSSLPGLGTLSSAPTGPRQQLAPGKPEINPVLLEKSDDLIKAEIQLRRQRVERSLKEELEQRRTSHKASEQLAELDVADILAKAMSLVLADAPAQSTDDTVANASASSDSFDDNHTFYSSRHDTPESNMVSRLPDESVDEEMREGSPYEPVLDLEPVARPSALPTQNIPGVAPVQQQRQPDMSAPIPQGAAGGVVVPGLSLGTGGPAGAHSQPQAPEAAGALQTSSGRRSEESSSAGNAQSIGGVHDLGPVNERLLNQALARAPSPRVYGHDLSPVAPQPTHVVPPPITRQSQLTAAESSGGAQAAPAQVAALRKQPSTASSPESSPQANKAAEKKKNKKKKRKADRLAAETSADSPYIKPEPRSPSPLTPQYARPHKRQRQSQQQPLVIHDDEPRYEQAIPVEEGYHDRYQPRVVRQERVVGYERADDYRRDDESVLVTSPRYERVYYDDHRAPLHSSYASGREPPQYVSREVRTMRPASRVVEAPYDDGGAPFYHRDVRAASRMSVRPAATHLERSQSPVMYERPPAAMPPPRAPPRRIIVDAYGREYLEPARPATVIREEVVPEPRAPYERVQAPRALSRRPEAMDDPVIYRPASPAYAAMPRRVVTHPEYTYRETGPATSSVPPPHHRDEYLPSRPEPPPREYITRSSSVRPPPVEATPVRYDTAAAGAAPVYERIPADPSRDYYRAASARPAADGGALPPRYEAPVGYEQVRGGGGAGEYPPPPPPPMRSASVRPAAVAGGPYERVGEYGGRRVEYAPPPASAGAYHQRRGDADAMAPPAPVRAYSVMPEEGHVVRREFASAGGGVSSSGVERYYGGGGRAGQGREREDEVVYLDRLPPGPAREGGYRDMR
ncbi:hypothetical protein VTK26DRAFT_6722 [Humicola hyalothermophila]